MAERKYKPTKEQLRVAVEELKKQPNRGTDEEYLIAMQEEMDEFSDLRERAWRESEREG